MDDLPMMDQEKRIKIEETIKDYFEGIFYGDVQKLRHAFNPNACLYGDIKSAAYAKNLDEYLEGVQNRKSPHDMGENFNMETLGIEVLGNVAMVKLHVPILGYNYYDFLSLCLINQEWKIVNKIFTHVE